MLDEQTITTPGGHVTTQHYDCSTLTEHLHRLEQHVTAQDAEIGRLQQRIADQGMMLAHLREIVQGEPPFLQPVGDFHVNE